MGQRATVWCTVCITWVSHWHIIYVISFKMSCGSSSVRSLEKVFCSILHCCLFYFIQTWAHSLLHIMTEAAADQKESMMHWWRFMVPLLSARTILSHQNYVNTVRTLRVRIYCVLLSYLGAHPRFNSLPILQVCSMYSWAISPRREFNFEPRWRSF